MVGGGLRPGGGLGAGGWQEHGDDPGWDAAEADRLYTLLETEIVPEFYRRNEAGVPEGWIARVRESLGRLTTGVFGQSRGAPVYGAALPAGGAELSGARGG